MKLPKTGKPAKPPIKDASDGTAVTGGVTAETEQLIGQFIVEWNHLEAAIGGMIWTILKVKEEDGRVLTSRVDAKTKITWTRIFAERYLSGDSITHIAQIINVIKTVQEARNLIVHGSWGITEDTQEPIALSLKASADPDKVLGETFPHERIKELIHNTKAARSEINVWNKRQAASYEK